MSNLLADYQIHVEERAALGILPKALDVTQTSDLIALLQNPSQGKEADLIALFENRIPAGVDEAAKIKAEFLESLAKGEIFCTLISAERATELLETMGGGYNVKPLVDLLKNEKIAPLAAVALSKTLLVFDSFNDVAMLAKEGNIFAKQVLLSWAEEEWLTSRPKLAEKVTLTVFKVVGETNTDDLSPAQDAWCRSDIPLHANAMLKMPREGIEPDDVRLLSEVQGDKVDEVFIGSCMTNIGHFRAAGKLLNKEEKELNTRLWLAPPTKMDAQKLAEEGYYNIYGRSGARTEMPGCSLCMGNQARVRSGCTAVSTSTRNFPNRLGQGARVYLASAELAAVAAILGKLPTPKEYQSYVADLDNYKAEIYNYLNFDKIPSYTVHADKVIFKSAVYK